MTAIVTSIAATKRVLIAIWFFIRSHAYGGYEQLSTTKNKKVIVALWAGLVKLTGGLKNLYGFPLPSQEREM
jgi:hypothetical protein